LRNLFLFSLFLIVFDLLQVFKGVYKELNRFFSGRLTGSNQFFCFFCCILETLHNEVHREAVLTCHLLYLTGKLLHLPSNLLHLPSKLLHLPSNLLHLTCELL